MEHRHHPLLKVSGRRKLLELDIACEGTIKVPRHIDHERRHALVGVQLEKALDLSTKRPA